MKIDDKLVELHTNSEGTVDREQLEVIFSKSDRIMVEAPAGYGKTKTMISKIAYLIATNQVPNPKRILTLTFSVNAAYKIKRDISEKLPTILVGSYLSPVELKRKIFSTNYHGLCRQILRLYGYLICPELKNIYYLKGIDDSSYNLRNLGIGLSDLEISQVSELGEKVKEIDYEYIQRKFIPYLEKVCELILPKGYITFNAILLFTIRLFEEYPNILKFYRSYFPIIMIDEYQDTNILSYMILKNMITDKTQLVIIGDPLQRIYGFIGAIRDIMPKSMDEFSLKRIVLKTNHRFSDNLEMLQLDSNIRENARDIKNPEIVAPANIRLMEARNQIVESENILKLVSSLLETYPSDKIAILVRIGITHYNTKKIIEILDPHLNYFNALFNDDDEEYIDFHNDSLDELMKLTTSSNIRVFKTISKRLFEEVNEKYREETNAVFKSLLKLLESFLKLVSKEFKFLTFDEKIEFIKDTLENRALKQYLEYVDTNVVIATIHGAKGLEWDYVILPDMEKDSLPTWRGICNTCLFKNNSCVIDWSECDETFEKKIYEELSIFYVGSTRAKKQITFSYSKTGVSDTHHKGISCFLRMKGMHPNIIGPTF